MNELFALAPAAWEDARAIFARRWWLILAVAILAGLYAFGNATSTNGGISDLAFISGLGMLVGLCVLSGFIFADTKRIDDPSYRLTAGRIFTLVLVGLGLAAIGLVLTLPLVFLHGLAPWIAPLWFAVVTILITTRLGYVFFGAEESAGPFAFSWRITAGRALLSSFVLAILQTLVAPIVGQLAQLALPQVPIGMAIAAGFASAISFGMATFFSPWTIRWMRVAESMQTVVVPE